MKIKNLDSNVISRIDKIINSKFKVILGDADGIDTSVQQLLKGKEYDQVTIYCSGNQPRNNVGRWPLKVVTTDAPEGTRAFFTAKDLQLAKDADYGLMIWDTKSTGTLSNVIELLTLNKKSLVYINKLKDFKSVSNVNDLEKLIEIMSPDALAKAEAKIKLKSRIDSFKFIQKSLFESLD